LYGIPHPLVERFQPILHDGLSACGLADDPVEDGVHLKPRLAAGFYKI
jgi:hypothetical protein